MNRLNPAFPACFCLDISFFTPYPPDPRSQSALPRWGRGRAKVFLCKGLRPLQPCPAPDATLPAGRKLEPGETGSPGCLRHLSERREGAAFSYRKISATYRGDARGEAPCKRKIRFSLFPGGEGGRGDGAEKICEHLPRRR